MVPHALTEGFVRMTVGPEAEFIGVVKLTKTVKLHRVVSFASVAICQMRMIKLSSLSVITAVLECAASLWAELVIGSQSIKLRSTLCH